MMNEDRVVSMADVAFAAGVFKMTVSRVLRADAKVAEATRLRVLAEVKRLGYRANPEASRAMAQFVRKGIRRNPSVLGVIALELGEFHEKDKPNRAPIWRGAETLLTQVRWYDCSDATRVAPWRMIYQKLSCSGCGGERRSMRVRRVRA